MDTRTADPNTSVRAAKRSSGDSGRTAESWPRAGFHERVATSTTNGRMELRVTALLALRNGMLVLGRCRPGVALRPARASVLEVRSYDYPAWRGNEEVVAFKPKVICSVLDPRESCETRPQHLARAEREFCYGGILDPIGPYRAAIRLAAVAESEQGQVIVIGPMPDVRKVGRQRGSRHGSIGYRDPRTRVGNPENRIAHLILTSGVARRKLL